MIRADTQKVPAIVRSWAVTVMDRECGVVTAVSHCEVTLTRTAAGIEGSVDGAPVELAAALRILQTAHHLTVISEELEPTTIGKPAAESLHRRLSRAGVPSKEHYGFASAALDKSVYSLALLTADERDAVLAFLASTHSAPVGEVAA